MELPITGYRRKIPHDPSSLKPFQEFVCLANEPSQFASFFNRLLGIPAVLKGILITLRRAASFSTAMHTAAFLAIYGRRLAGLSAPSLRAASQTGKHRASVALVLSRHPA